MLNIAPNIIRSYFWLFSPLGATVLATYYIQYIMRSKMSALIAILLIMIVIGILLIVLPMALGLQSIWLAMPVFEVLVAVLALTFIRCTNSAVKAEIEIW